MSSFEDRVSGIVQSVLSDSTQLPAEFVSALPQIVAQNPVPVAKTSGMRLASGNRTADVSTTGTTFAAGADLLSSALRFTATGSNNYIVRAHAWGWTNDTNAAENILRLNYDGADGGFMAGAHLEVATHYAPVTGVALISPAAGSHSINVRLTVSAGTGTVKGGTGGAGASLAIVVTVEVA